jgi:hypothetical protein
MTEKKTDSVKIRIVDTHKTLKGVFGCRVYKNVNGEKRLIEEYVDDNLIVNMARDQMARLIAGEFDDRNITTIGFGTDDTKPAVGDTKLTDAFMKALNGYELPETMKNSDGDTVPMRGQVQFNWSLETGEANGKAIREFGLFCKDGTLFARRRREKVGGEPADPIYKEADITLEGTWTIIF